MRSLVFLGILASVIACTRANESAGGSAVAPTTSATAAATAAATATSATSNAVVDASSAGLHAQSCPPPPSRYVRPPNVTQGCESCPAGQFCREFSDHGRETGFCAKNECEKDADCKGGLCACALPYRCYPGNCRTTADCGGRECAPDRWRYGHGQGVYCRTDHDECTSHAQCGSGRECAYLGTKWGCRTEVPAPPPG